MGDMSKEKSSQLRYGWKKIKPNWLQILKGPKGFLFFLAMFSTTQGIVVNGTGPAVLPTIEKAYGFTSTEIGVILASNDVAGLLLVTFVSFFGGKGHRPKWIGIGSIVTGLGALIFTFPKLIIEKYQPSSIDLSKNDLCFLNKSLPLDACSSVATSTSGISLFIFCFGQFIMGAGTSPLFTLGPSFIDDTVDKKRSPIYLGIWYTSTLLGPGLGMLAATGGLSIFVDIKQPPGFSLTVDDPRWIGAWWLSYFSFGLVLLLVGFFLCGYPITLREGDKNRKEELSKKELEGEDKSEEANLRAMLSTTWKLLRNKPLMFMILGQTVRTFQGVGLGSFIVKLIVIRYGASFQFAGTAAGLLILPSMTAGIMGVSFVMKKTNKEKSGYRGIQLCTILTFISAFTALFNFIPGCNDTNLAGIKLPYSNGSQNLGSLNSLCNTGCICNRDSYLPVCGNDGLTYFSPCYAGCKNKTNNKEYQNCICVNSSGGEHGGSVKVGRCDRDCKNLAYYLVGVAVAVLVSFSIATPHQIGVFRIIGEKDKSFVMGLQYLIVRSLSFVPAPVIVGTILDESCLLWKKDICGFKGECLEYRLDDIILHIVTMALVIAVVATIFYGLAWYFYSSEEISTTDFGNIKKGNNAKHCSLGEKRGSTNDSFESSNGNLVIDESTN